MVDVLAVAGAVGGVVVANTVIHAERVVGVIAHHRRALARVLVADEWRLADAEVRYTTTQITCYEQVRRVNQR